jgi:hypothetical protein
MEAPQFTPAFNVEGDDEAATRNEAGGDTLNHFVAHDEGSAPQAEGRALHRRRADLDGVVPHRCTRVRIKS